MDNRTHAKDKNVGSDTTVESREMRDVEARIAHMARDLLGTYLCAGAFAMLLWQLFQNIAMTMGIMPITGLPLPFVSYGGSALLVNLAAAGLLYRVSAMNGDEDALVRQRWSRETA